MAKRMSEREELEVLVRKETAFRSYTDMARSMYEGYVPSIYSRGPSKKDKKRLTALLLKRGWKVWDGVTGRTLKPAMAG